MKPGPGNTQVGETLQEHSKLTLLSVGIAADHGGFELKEYLVTMLRTAGHAVTDFGAHQLKPDDDYPDFVIPLARAVAAGTVDRGIGICGSGVGASIAANKVAGVRAGLIEEIFAAHQGVEDDNMNMICFGGQLVGRAVAWELTQTFLAARFKGMERFGRRLAKVSEFEDAPTQVVPGLDQKIEQEAVEAWRNEGDPN